MTQRIPKADVLALMRRIGLQDEVARAEKELPEIVDTDRDQKLLNEFGISSSRDALMNDLGSSP